MAPAGWVALMVGQDWLMRELRLVHRRWREKYPAQRLGEFVAQCRGRGIPVTPQRLSVAGASSLRRTIGAPTRPVRRCVAGFSTMGRNPGQAGSQKDSRGVRVHRFNLA